MKRETFIERWADAIERGTAAAFIGAGLSCGAGYPTWRQLLLDIADELGLDIEQEHDLAGIAQYSLNRDVGRRHKLNQLIRDHFPPKPAPEPFRILARLPLRHIWTTNYDKLPEAAWSEERKLLEVKSRNSDLSGENAWSHAVLYKMHGTVDHPSEVVIAKDDYELYRRERAGFLQLLTGHLISKHILFLGFGFSDPNLSHLFGIIRETFKDDGPEHYAIVRKPQLERGKNARRRFELNKIRHALWVQDLKRYGIECVEVDEYAEIDDILQSVERALAQRSVFVGGSFPDTVAPADLDRRRYIEEIARGVGALIAKRQKRLVSGFGLVVGSAAIAGTLGVLLKEDTPNLEKTLLLRPFPQEPPPGIDPGAFRRRYRDGMLRQAGVAVFIAGEKDMRVGKATKRVVADGVLDEFESAKALGRTIIPIGATGGAAAQLWTLVAADRARLCPGASAVDFARLNDPAATPAKLLGAVDGILSATAPTPRRRGRR